MAKLGAGDRLKGKLERSSWVDSTEWVVDGEPDSPGQSVEFLEVDPEAYRLSPGPAGAPPSRVSSNSSRLILFVAGFLVIVALFLISRPDGDDPLSQLPYEQQQEILQRQNGLAQDDEVSSTTSAPSQPQPIPAPAPATPSRGADEPIAAQDLPPVPPLPEDLPEDLPGTLAIYGDAGSVVFADWIRGAAQEVIVGQPGQELIDGPMVAGDPQQLSAPVLVPGTVFDWVIPDGEGWPVRVVAAAELRPADDGVAVVEGSPADGQEVILSTFEQISNNPRDGELFALVDDQQLLGGWQGRLVIFDGDTVGLLDQEGGLEPVTIGEPIVYDGQHLAVVQCVTPDECQVVAGTVDEPELRRVPVPAGLLGRPLDTWTPQAALSPDGTRLALADQGRNAELSWIDLETGEHLTRAMSYNVQSPVAWAPDGRHLAYASNGNVIIWDTETDETWLVRIGRSITSFVWFEDGGG